MSTAVFVDRPFIFCLTLIITKWSVTLWVNGLYIYLRGMAGKFVDTISIFNRNRNSVKMNISGFAQIFHEQIDEIL